MRIRKTLISGFGIGDRHRLLAAVGTASRHASQPGLAAWDRQSDPDGQDEEEGPRRPARRKAKKKGKKARSKAGKCGTYMYFSKKTKKCMDARNKK